MKNYTYTCLEEALTLEMYRQGMDLYLIFIVMSALKTEAKKLLFGKYLVSIQEKTVPDTEVVLEAYKIANGIVTDYQTEGKH